MKLALIDFFIPFDNWKQYFLQFIFTQRLGATLIPLRSLLLHNNIKRMLIPKVQNKASTYRIFQQKLFADNLSLTFSDIVNVPNFPLKMKFL